MLCSCSTPPMEQYASNQPTLIPSEFFDGHLIAKGIIKNRAGEVTRYFTADIQAYWENGKGTLAERFEFNDGEIQLRTWTLTPNGDGYDATAGDVLGIGKVKLSGNAMQLNYLLEINYKNSPLALSVEDWMWQVDESTILNESILRKWGFKVGSVQLTIQRNNK